MQRPESSDRSRSYFRSGTRIFNLNGAWYFGAREGDQGPFARREIALREMARYALEKKMLWRFQKSRESLTDSSELTLEILPMEEPLETQSVR